MRKLIYISLLLSLLSFKAKSQGVATATMRVSATIISGATLNNIQAINLDFEDETRSVGGFEFIAPSNADTQVEIENSIIATNEFGDIVTINSNSTLDKEKGKHSISLNATVNQSESNVLRGSYQGNINTIINYL